MTAVSLKRPTPATWLHPRCHRVAIAVIVSQHAEKGVPRAACRGLGGDRVPEYFAKPSPYTEGTAFLGTPVNHEEVIIYVLNLACRDVQCLSELHANCLLEQLLM